MIAGIFFAEPHWAWLFLGIPMCIALIYYAERKKLSGLKKIGHPAVIEKLTRNVSAGRKRFKYALLILFCFFITLAAMRPQWGRKLTKMERFGIDIVFVIDVSRSMLAEDIQPNRIEKAKLQISSFLDRIHGDRVGLVIFAGSSFVSCPLTLDYNALKLFIDMITTDMVARQGTLIGNALKTARTKCFNSAERSHKAIVLLTDGEDHDSGPLDEAGECKKEGIRIFTIGIGKTAGRPIPVRDEAGEFKGYVQDRKGNIVLSKIDEDTLKKIAMYTGGNYYYSQYGELELDRIYQKMQDIEKKRLGSLKMQQREDRYQIFLIIALCILLAEFFIPVRRQITFQKEFSTEGGGRYD